MLATTARRTRHTSRLALGHRFISDVIKFTAPQPLPAELLHERRQRLLFGDNDGTGTRTVQSIAPAIPEERAMVVMLGHRMRFASRNIFHPFVQETGMRYLVGDLSEPNMAALLVKRSTAKSYKLVIFVNERTATEQLWDGAGIDRRTAVERFGAHEAHHMRDFYAVCAREYESLCEEEHANNGSGAASLSSSSPPAIYVDVKEEMRTSDDSRQHTFFPSPPNIDSSTAATFLANLPGETSTYRALAPRLDRQRLRKSSWERAQMQRAADISGEAFVVCMQEMPRVGHERELEALFEYECRRRGAERMAYVPVVAGSGARACVVHYTKNDQAVEPRDMILMDAGASFNGYAADITRTFPARGTFTPPQRELYTALLNVQQQVIETARPSSTSRRTLTDLLQLSAHLVEEEICRKLFGMKARNLGSVMRWIYPHHIGHWLGMDVHDCGEAGVDVLEEGMALTVEPGIYLPEALARRFNIPERYHNIGIRIEDDLILGRADEAPVVLTRNTPKTVEDIEALMTGRM